MFGNLNHNLTPQIAWAPDDGTSTGDDSGADAATAAAAAGAAEGAEGAGDADAAAAAAAAAAADDESGEGAGKWWEDKRFTDDQRQTLTASGLTVDDPLEALAKLTDMERAAQKKLGAKPGDLISKPKEGQPVAEWLRENGATLGIPEAPDGYKVERPDFWPKDTPWDDKMEAQVREIAHEEGVTGPALNRMVSLYAKAQIDQLQAANDDLAKAQGEMMTALEADWGDQTKAKLAEARQALSVIAEAAGMDHEAQFNLLSVMGQKGGDANAWKFMSTLAGMMGEDGMAGLQHGNKSLATTPAEARAQLQKLRGEGGEYYKAVEASNRTEMDRLQPTIDRLTRIAAG